eukprot:COSAG05_NODE_5018_length_1288_cov_2.618167_2_plen_128_part_00
MFERPSAEASARAVQVCEPWCKAVKADVAATKAAASKRAAEATKLKEAHAKEQRRRAKQEEQSERERQKQARREARRRGELSSDDEPPLVTAKSRPWVAWSSAADAGAEGWLWRQSRDPLSVGGNEY